VSLLAERSEEVAPLFGSEVSPTKVANDQTQVARAESANSEDNTLGSE
jgi:hypothetical protein